MPNDSAFVLIPGAFHGGWVWHPVAQRLRAAGRRAVSVTLPGMGDGAERDGIRLADATQHVIAEIERLDLGEVTLVGHSLGGITIADVAARARDRVAKLIFFSAFVPTAGSSMNDGNPPENAEFVRSMIESTPDHSIPVPFEAFAAAMMQDSPEAAQRVVHNLLSPAPGGYFLDPYDGPDVTALGIPTAYVLAEHDHGLAVPGDELARRLDVEPIMVPGNHEALLTHPDAVAEALLRA